MFIKRDMKMDILDKLAQVVFEVTTDQDQTESGVSALLSRHPAEWSMMNEK